jgi:putative transposase
MRNPTVYLKMRVLGAVDMAEGDTEQKRIQAVSQMTFTDEEGYSRQFTWRTISTWLCRYRKHGVTVMENKSRSDKGQTRKVKPEDIQEAIQAVLPKVHGRPPKRSVLYRLCIEQGLLNRSQVARTTFYRLVNSFELLKPEAQTTNKVRLAFA